MGVVFPQPAQQIHQGAFLGIGACVGRMSVFIKTALVADAEALVVPAGGVGADLVGGAADVEFAVAGDVEVVADAGEAALQVTAAQGLRREITVATGGAAMNHQEAHLPVVLIETSCSHRANGRCRSSGRARLQGRWPR